MPTGSGDTMREKEELTAVTDEQVAISGLNKDWNTAMKEIERLRNLMRALLDQIPIGATITLGGKVLDHDVLSIIRNEIRVAAASALPSPELPAGGSEPSAWQSVWSNGDITFSRFKPQETCDRVLIPLYAPAPHAAPNAQTMPDWERVFLICAEVAGGMGRAAAYANVFGRLSEAYGAVKVTIEQLADQARKGEPIEDNNGLSHSFAPAPHAEVRATEAREKEITRLATIEECAKIADRYREQRGAIDSAPDRDAACAMIASDIRALALPQSERGEVG